ncbi:DUF1446-domain-containing protein [Lophiostoma macrostomum CBS 122681]|uniref:DUF1446-domain-containing protein n=1 Tax=Lophiostoma macrostomum CBS 122681 TaxID=1314788 RepID=A0A6A6T8Y5_9PLEO|nr:DUF1446-domain-containing protein [Lophiostoma macrostomum CBS 122681]
MKLLASNYEHDPIDVLVGDWMSEGNMTARAGSKVNGQIDAYEPTFLEALEPALPYIAKYHIKVAVNAGASDTKKLHEVVTKLIRARGFSLSVAWIAGDEVLPQLLSAQKCGESTFENICTGEKLDDWVFEPIYAQAYLGGLGIAKAFEKGADIVICGRVSDASPVIGSAYWWHQWQRSDLDKLANAFVAGHLSECSSYATGGNYSGFKDLECLGWENIGYPIVEIAQSGEVIVTKNQGSGGQVSVDTLTSQFLYEIQGPWYFNSDVTAILNETSFEQLSANRVALRGVKDRALMAPHLTNFCHLSFQTIGSVPRNPSDQNAATVDFRVIAQARKAEDLAPSKFVRPCIDPIMCAYPGATPHLDLRQAFPKEVFEYYVTLLLQASIQHQVHLQSGDSIEVSPPPMTRTYPKHQPLRDITQLQVDMSKFGATVRAPLGYVVHARSGDKGSDCNVGFWVRFQDEYSWIQNLLSTNFIKALLADEYKGHPVERCEFPGLKAVHFLLKNHLDRGLESDAESRLINWCPAKTLFWLGYEAVMSFTAHFGASTNSTALYDGANGGRFLI